jgi:hypothetical protein
VLHCHISTYNLFGFRQSQLCFSKIFIITTTYPLHVSAPTGLLRVEYTGYFPRSYFFYNGSVVLVLVINYIYIYIIDIYSYI